MELELSRIFFSFLFFLFVSFLRFVSFFRPLFAFVFIAFFWQVNMRHMQLVAVSNSSCYNSDVQHHMEPESESESKCVCVGRVSESPTNQPPAVWLHYAPVATLPHAPCLLPPCHSPVARFVPLFPLTFRLEPGASLLYYSYFGQRAVATKAFLI